MFRRISASNGFFRIFLQTKFINSATMSSESSEVSKRKQEDSNSEQGDVKKQKLTDQKEHVLKTVLEHTKAFRKPKKVVMLLSYLGKNFYGMQRNHGVNTVEEELFKALLKTEIIIKDEFDFPKNMKFQRAARTDKGVSAIRQIVSLRIPLRDITQEIATRLNQVLPEDVRVIGLKRVTQSFDAKIACDARTYSYMLPTFAFSTEDDGSPEEYRITSDKLEEINIFLKNYLGTHNFFNFTSGRLPGDPSCKRYILSCECGPPFESRDLEFCVIRIKGQSFMLHQIRKMVGLAIAITRKLADSSLLQKAWANERLDIPKAPGLGLMLEDVHYDWYNSKYGSDGIHEPILWNEFEDVVENFKKEKICANIAQTERDEKSMLQWQETLPHHSYDVREDGPPSKLPPIQQNSKKSGNIAETSGKDEETVEKHENTAKTDQIEDNSGSVKAGDNCNKNEFDSGNEQLVKKENCERVVESKTVQCES